MNIYRAKFRETISRVKRTVLQLIISGSLTAGVQDWANLSPKWSVAIMMIWMTFVTFTQNTLEDAKKIKDRRLK